MENTDAIEFYDAVVDDEPGQNVVEQIELEHESGRRLEVNVLVVERDEILDQLQRLPDAMLEVMTEAEDTEEAQERAQEQNMLSDVNGDVVKAFEDICATGLEHHELTSDHFRQMVSEFDFPVLFGVGSRILEVSFENTGSVEDFHAPDSDKNS